MVKRNWIDVDLDGYAALIENPEKLVLELWQNAVDEDVTQVRILLRPHSRGLAYVEVEDDSPEGFTDLGESYRMYAPSKKRDDATKRGRMNVGEKRVLALCKSATIESTTGRVCFHESGERSHSAKYKRAAGTVFTGYIRLKKEELDAALALLDQILVPEGVTLTVNDKVIKPRPALREFQATLNTVLPDEDGKLNRRSRRKTTVRLVEPTGVELPTIFEMGIPVVEHDGKFHIDVQQRVPLSEARDNVPPSYLRELREHVLNNTFDLLEPEDSHTVWVADALPAASPEALQSFVKARYGDKVVVRDNSHEEATQRALDAGYAVIEGRHLPKGVVGILRQNGIVKAAGEHKEFRRDTEYDPNGVDRSVPEKDWTPGMQKVVAYTKALALELLGGPISVVIERYPFHESNHRANFGGRHLRFNLSRLSHRFFNEGSQREIDELLLHEFSHDKASNHWSDEFINALEENGAKLRYVKFFLTDFEGA